MFCIISAAADFTRKIIARYFKIIKITEMFVEAPQFVSIWYRTLPLVMDSLHNFALE